MTNTEEQIYNAALELSKQYFNGDELAGRVFLDKYALRDNEQNLLEKTPEDMHHRIASEFARIEKGKFKKPLTENTLMEMFRGFSRIVPQGSPMYGIGNRFQFISLSNCYVVDPPLDSYGGICKTDQQLVQISKRRGGNGTDISLLRPNKAPTKNAARTSTGIIPFMRRFSNSIREVGQEGRRGALMLTISVHHPEVEAFATIKNDDKEVTGANISIRLTDEFLGAVAEGVEYEQRWPCTPEDAKKLGVNFPVISRKVDARKVWRTIIESAWKRAEPGLLFWDNILRESIPDCYADLGFKTVSTNPCSEIPLSPLDSCRLLLLNIYGYVRNPFTKEAYFDYTAFYEDAQVAQRLMDDLVDLEIECIDRIIAKIGKDPEPADVKHAEIELWKGIKKACIDGRRTGTGITGLGDTLAALNVRYGSPGSIEVTDRIYKTLKFGAYRASVDMAKELGPFPIWDAKREKENPFLNRIKDETITLTDGQVVSGKDIYNDMQKHGRRNIALLTTAPAGTVSTLTQTTSGIEPAFKLSYVRRKKVNPSDVNARVDYKDAIGDSWQEFTIYHHKVEDWMKITGETDLTKSPWWGCCAGDLDWEKRVQLQAVANKHVDHAISSTINLPETVTVEKVAEIYEAAWRAGCKGITVYRDNCRSGVLVAKKEEKKKDQISKTDAPPRPKVLPCDVYHVKVKGNEYFVLVGMLGNDPYEVFAGRNGSIPKAVKKGEIEKLQRGKYQARFDDGTIFESVSDHCEDWEEAICRLTSTGLRHGARIDFIVQQLEKIPGPDMLAFYKALARALKKYIPDGTKVSGEVCQTCGAASLVRQEGCVRCMNCAWTKCS